MQYIYVQCDGRKGSSIKKSNDLGFVVRQLLKVFGKLTCFICISRRSSFYARINIRFGALSLYTQYHTLYMKSGTHAHIYFQWICAVLWLEEVEANAFGQSVFCHFDSNPPGEVYEAMHGAAEEGLSKSFRTANDVKGRLSHTELTFLIAHTHLNHWIIFTSHILRICVF